MNKFIVGWDAGYGMSYEVVVCANLEEAEQYAYASWNDEVEGNASYEALEWSEELEGDYC